MVRLLNRALRKSNKENETEPAPRPRGPDAPTDRILVLIPGEGGFAFRLFAFPSIDQAAAYVDEHFPYRGDHIYAFRPHHQRPATPVSGLPGPIEAVVMVRDAERHGSVHLYSFVDMETAQAFVRAEGMRGLNLRLALIFWAEPLSLYDIQPGSGYVEASAQAFAAPPEEPHNALFDTLTRAEAAPSALSEEIAPAPALEPAPQPVEPDPMPAAPPPPPAPVAQKRAPAPVPPPAPVPLMMDTPASVPSFDVFAPPPAAAAPLASSYTSQKKQPRRWNAGDTAPQPSPADATTAPARPGLIKKLLSWPGWDGFGPIIRNAALLKWETYDEVRKDPYAAGRAGVLVGATVGAAALSAFFVGPLAFFFHGFFAAIGWAVYALCIYVVGTQFFGGKMERGETNLFLQRLGFAFAPGPLIVLGIFPVYGPLFTLVGLIWVMMTSIKATEVGLEMDRQSAAYTVIISWLALFAIAVVIPTIAS